MSFEIGLQPLSVVLTYEIEIVFSYFYKYWLYHWFYLDFIYILTVL